MKTMNLEKCCLGIELGSTRIKAVLIDENRKTVSSSGYEWVNKFVNGIWTYDESEVWQGLRACYRALKQNVKDKFGVTPTKFGAIGISAMMHGYLALDRRDKILTPFRTWRNNNAERDAEILTEAFDYPIPARWSIAHLYHAVREGEPHTCEIAFLTTLAGYVHYMLTGRKVIGIGDASGMFPIDIKSKDYDEEKIKIFETLAAQAGADLRFRNIFPKVLLAGGEAGSLTERGAGLLDAEGDLKAGIPLCPPEGDAGTGMAATNSLKRNTGNISAGTSIFAMMVLEKQLRRVHPEVDLVTTPSGELVAMVHCNNCSSEINAWTNLFDEVVTLSGGKIDRDALYTKLFTSALKGDDACGGMVSYNYSSGENITRIEEGCPMLIRTAESRFDLSNFMRMQIYAAFATLKMGLDILRKEENVELRSVLAHGGIFKTKGVAQKFLAAALNTPVTVNKSADEGGAWGIAVLAEFMLRGGGKSLENYFDDTVFAQAAGETLLPDASDVAGFEAFMEKYVRCLPVVRQAITALKK